MSRKFLSLALPSLLLLSACTSAVFESNADILAPGVSYSLPKTFLKVKIEAMGRGVGDRVAELTTSEFAAAGANETNGVVRVMARIDGQQRSVLVDKNGKLTENLVTSLRIASIEPEQVADLSHSYVLQYRPDAVYSDRVCMGVNNKGLLSYVEAAVKDETPNIIVSIAKFAGRLAGPQPFVAGTGVPQVLDELELKIDPYSEADRRAASDTIDERFPDFRGRFQLLIERKGSTKARGKRESCPLGSICYRTAVPVRVALVDRASRQMSLRYVNVANLAEVNNIDITRAFLVEKVARFGFDNGMLQYAAVRKPSETLELAKLPLTVYDAVMSSALAAPGQFARQIVPGVPPAEVLEILKSQAALTKDAADLQAELQRIREDIAPGGTVGAAPAVEAVALLKVGCAFQPPPPPPAKVGG